MAIAVPFDAFLNITSFLRLFPTVVPLVVPAYTKSTFAVDWSPHAVAPARTALSASPAGRSRLAALT